MKTKLPYDIKQGHDGNWYIVFASNYEREEFNKRNPGEIDGYPVCCFSGYENAHGPLNWHAAFGREKVS